MFRIRRWCDFLVDVLGCLLIVGVTAYPVAVHAGQEGPVASAEYTEVDKRLMAELKAEIEGIPPEERMQRGIEIIRAHIHEAESDDARGALLLSLGKLSGELGQSEQSKGFFSQAMKSCSGDTGLSAARHLLHLYREEYNYAAAAETAMYVLNEKKLSPEQDVRFTGELGLCLAADNKSDEALALVHGLVDRYSEHVNLVAEFSETIAINQGMRGNAKVYYAGMKWVEDHAPEYAETPRFLGNYAHACREDGRLEKAKQLYLRVVQEFPDHNRGPEFLLELGNIHKEAGDILGAYSFYMTLLQREPGNDKESKPHDLAKTNVISIERRLGIEEALSEMTSRSISSLDNMMVTGEGTSKTQVQLQAHRSVTDRPANKTVSPGTTTDAIDRYEDEGVWAGGSVAVLCAGAVLIGLVMAAVFLWRRKRVRI